MIKQLSCCLALLAIAIAGPADGQQLANQTRTAQGTLGQALLIAIETWLSNQFDLPNIKDHPRVEFVPPEKIAALRSNGLLSDPGARSAPSDQRTSPPQHDTVAVYYDPTRTIYLPESWTGGTAGELSILVHEMVHHFQNVLALKHECPQDREKLAYLAQERWLGLFGHSLESDFDLDPFSLLVKTKCFY
jgi:hypothetical protein